MIGRRGARRLQPMPSAMERRQLLRRRSRSLCLIRLPGRELMRPLHRCRSARLSQAHRAIEGVQMSTALSRLYSAISLSLVALLLSSSIVHAQRSGESGAEVYRIDPQTSEVRLLVYPDGALSTFGHTHVVSLKARRPKGAKSVPRASFGPEVSRRRYSGRRCRMTTACAATSR